MRDLVGLGFRSDLFAGIAANLDRIDVVEVLAEDALARSRRRLRALRTLAAQVPVLVHGTTLGLASRAPAEEKRLDRLARTVNAIEPRAWSEHLAFVRAGGIEIGHLAAPPRDRFTAEGAARNLERAHRIVGTLPAIENVATLVEPPGDFSEIEFIECVLSMSRAPLLLDLHNLYANARNHGFDARAFIARLPADRIAPIHLAGGRSIGRPGSRRVLDDHLHPVPPEVFSLLEEVAARVAAPLTVILERDGNYPPIQELLDELELARAALRRGRERAPSAPAATAPARAGRKPAADEALLARLYTDPAALARYLRDAPPDIDRVGLQMAAESFAKKRAAAAR